MGLCNAFTFSTVCAYLGKLAWKCLKSVRVTYDISFFCQRALSRSDV